MKFYITGFTACGKTTIGKQLAEELQLDFIDLDEYIEEKTGKKISDIFTEEGETVFRQLESDCLKEISSNADLKVVSLGGGTICNTENLKLILSTGICIYLERTEDYYKIQLPYLMKTRPMFKGLTEREAENRLGVLMAKRAPYYGKSQLQTLVTSEFSAKKLANTLKLLTNRPQSL